MLTVFAKWTRQQQKPLKYVLSDTVGIGISTSKKILLQFGIQNAYKYGRTSVDLQKELSQYVLNEDADTYILTDTLLKDKIRRDIQRLKDIRSYRGVRHLINLPVRGQRTKTNSRTQKSHKTKAHLLRTSYRYKRPLQKTSSQKKMNSEVSNFLKLSKKRSRGRFFLQA